MDDTAYRGPARLHVAVARELIRRITSGALLPGALLPTETELCQEFRVSRSVIRETMRILAEKGLVDVRQGKGTFVAPVDRWDQLDLVILEERIRTGRIGDVIEDLLEVRRLVEVQTVGLAALRADVADITRLRGLVSEMYRCIEDPGGYSQLDNAFHEAIGLAAKNDMLARLTTPIYLILRAGRSATNHAIGDRHTSQQGHEAIVGAIAQHDPEQAQRAMADHIALFEHDIRLALVDQSPKDRLPGPRLSPASPESKLPPATPFSPKSIWEPSDLRRGE